MRRIASAVFPLTLFVVACLAAGFFTALLTDSLVVTAIAGLIAGSAAGWVSNAVRRRRAGDPPEASSNGESDPGGVSHPRR